LFHCNDEQRERFLKPVLRGEMRVCFAQTEPDAGSDPAGMQTRAVRDGEYFVLNGTKRFISGAGRADYAQVMAVTDPEKRARGGITCFMVDMKSPGVILDRRWPTMMGDAPWQIVFDGARAPAANVIGKVGEGFSLAQQWIQDGRIKGHGARPVGIAERALEMMMDYSRHRVTFGRPLAERQAVQFMIADSFTEHRMTQLLVYQLAARTEAGAAARHESYMAKIAGTELGFRVADRCLQIHDGIGLATEMPISQMWRDARSFMITEGPVEVMRMVLAREILRGAG